METFMEALKVAEEYGEEYITFGGGEPTLHPSFFNFLRQALYREFNVWLASNGSKKNVMMRLAKIMDEEDEEDDPICICHSSQLSVALSTDHYHSRDKVKDDVWSLWNRRALQHRSSTFQLRDVSNHIVKAGRAEESELWHNERECICNSLFVSPNGTLKGCGCKDAKVFGTVFDYDIPEDWQIGECSFSDENTTWREENKGLHIKRK